MSEQSEYYTLKPDIKITVLDIGLIKHVWLNDYCLPPMNNKQFDELFKAEDTHG